MKIQQLLNELFNTAVPYKFVDNKTAVFELNGKTFAVWFQPSMNYDDALDVSFGLQNGTYTGTDTPKYVHHSTGTGNEMAVFGAVTNIVREFMGMTNMSKLVFSAALSEPTRVKLYDRMISRIAPNWPLKEKITTRYKIYILTKPDAYSNERTDDSYNL